jgi:hypothetical protein
MIPENLTALLAQRVMGWRPALGRFLMENRRWLPSHRFQPTERIQDAFRLLEKAAPYKYKMRGDDTGVFYVHVQIGRATGEAQGRSKPLAIALAVARALGEEIPEESNAGVSLPSRRRSRLTRA